MYNLRRAQVATLVNETTPAGSYAVTWKVQHFAGGIYFVRLEAAIIIMP